MKVTVCELNDSEEGFARDWERLAAHVKEHRSDLVLLPEMPFCPWFAWRPDFEKSIWQDAVAAHDTAWQEATFFASAPGPGDYLSNRKLADC